MAVTPGLIPAPELTMPYTQIQSSFETAPLRPLVAEVPIDMLASFARLMTGEGWHVDLARMCLDRLYAYERIAQAHTSAQDKLRSVAVDMFAAYDRHAAVRWLQ